MINIIINKNKCKLDGEGLHTNLLKTIDNELSFEISGARFMPAFNKSGWDGRKHLFNNKLIFPKGCLDRVINILSTYNVDYNIINNNKLTPSIPKDISKQLEKIKKIPRDYQLESSEKVLQYTNGIFKLATGSGKSVLMALITAQLNKSTIIYVVGLSLLYQMHDLFVSIFGEDCVGIVGDGLCNIKTGPTDINIVSVWTAGLALGMDKKKIINDEDDIKLLDGQNLENKSVQIKLLLSTSKVHIIDECHASSCASIDEINKVINAEHLYGLSASPFADGGKGEDLIIESILGSIIVNLSASYFIERKLLMKPIIKFIEIPKIMFPKSDTYQTIYKEYVIENEVRNNIIMNEAVVMVNKGYKVLILYKNIKHGKILFDKLKNQISCELLSGKDDNEIREAAKIKMENGEINCVIASTIFDQGIDWPILSCLINSNGGKSAQKCIQRIGRILRLHDSKKNGMVAIIDFLDQARHLKDHSLTRKKIYETEPQFKIIWPKKK